ncbi:lysylphosphatidylglycerol synthase transmembrane domain-containing protein [Rubrivirga marina]|uniref:TIGR00374 family protein n=1 Tax=Rubrivirga marina TaxID=1196024 RepID=A0A271J2W8_9BACT|nr:lysylphosphatidylglycerol synthase transmembrane domain-containing protein [Rubrivirga marina]PAP77690.1 hypothetical protein BSZ37_15190 [Rubrivirga marina]
MSVAHRFPARRLLRAAAWLIPLGVALNVGVALLTTDGDAFREVGPVSPAAVVLCVGVALLPWATQSLRIGIWTRFAGHPIGFLSGLRIAAGGVLGSAVTPTAVGGGTIRWALATRRGLPPGHAASFLAVEAVEDLVFFAIALPLALMLSTGDEASSLRAALRSPAPALDDPVFTALLGAAAVGGALAVGARLALSGHLGARARHRARRIAARVRRPLRQTARDVRYVLALVARDGKRWFALSLSLTAVQWIARYSIATFVIALLGGPLRPFLFWILSWMTYAVSSAVPTPGAAGAAEATFYVLHLPFVGPERLVVATAAWRLLMFYVPALVASVAYPALGLAEREPAETAPEAEDDEAAPPLPAHREVASTPWLRERYA